MFKTDFDTQINSIQEKFSDFLNLQSLPAVKQITLPAGVDLEQIALEELGDATRWVEIAELNGLKAPFISQDLTFTGKNVLVPGDTLLIPQENIFGFSENPDGKDIPSTEGLSAVEKSLGTDFKLNDSFDLDLANNGDLSVISGTGNMAQAIVLKIQYEKGEVRNHPRLGVGVQVGSKFLSLEEIRDNLLNSLRQDSRVESISDVQLLRDGPALFMQFNIHIKKVDTPIPLKVKL
jgi:hypothetical protein